MHFEITKYTIFLGKGLPPYNTQKSYTFKPQKGPEIFSSPIVEISYDLPNFAFGEKKMLNFRLLATPKLYT